MIHLTSARLARFASNCLPGLLSLLLLVTGCRAADEPEASAETPPTAGQPKEVSPQLVLDYVAGYTLPRWTGNKVKVKANDTRAQDYLWLLRIADRTRDESLRSALESHVRQQWLDAASPTGFAGDMTGSALVGASLLELHRQTTNDLYLAPGMGLANRVWGREAPHAFAWKTPAEMETVHTSAAMAVLAAHATGEQDYLERAALAMVALGDTAQSADGLFRPAADDGPAWSRANGVVAQAMCELLSALPEAHAARAQVLRNFQRLMAGALRQQNTNGSWHLIMDQPGSYEESSGSAWLLSALVSGVEHGWLERETCEPAIEAGWKGLTRMVNDKGLVYFAAITPRTLDDLRDDANLPAQRGGRHGQVAMFFCAMRMTTTGATSAGNPNPAGLSTRE